MRSLIAILLASMLLLAGCAEDSKSTPETTDDTGDDGGDTGGDSGTDGDDGTDDGGSGGDSGSDGNGTSNTAPTASLVASATNGTAPLPVNFTLDGSDADGDNLTFTLSINGNFTANGTLPASFEQTFEAGEYTVILNVTDGIAFVEANLTIVVQTGEPEEEVDPNAPINKGWYTYYPETEICQVHDFTDVGGAGLIYRAPLSGGDWIMIEDNGMPGLQIENNHPLRDEEAPVIGNLGFALNIPECKNGDLVAV